MPVDQSLVGRVFPPTRPYAVTEEGIGSFVLATGGNYSITTSAQEVRSRREQSNSLLVSSVAMVCGYIPMHKTTFIKA